MTTFLALPTGEKCTAARLQNGCCENKSAWSNQMACAHDCCALPTNGALATASHRGHHNRLLPATCQPTLAERQKLPLWAPAAAWTARIQILLTLWQPMSVAHKTAPASDPTSGMIATHSKPRKTPVHHRVASAHPSAKAGALATAIGQSPPNYTPLHNSALSASPGQKRAAALTSQTKQVTLLPQQ